MNKDMTENYGMTDIERTILYPQLQELGYDPTMLTNEEKTLIKDITDIFSRILCMQSYELVTTKLLAANLERKIADINKSIQQMIDDTRATVLLEHNQAMILNIEYRTLNKVKQLIEEL